MILSILLYDNFLTMHKHSKVNIKIGCTHNYPRAIDHAKFLLIYLYFYKNVRPNSQLAYCQKVLLLIHLNGEVLTCITTILSKFPNQQYNPRTDIHVCSFWVWPQSAFFDLQDSPKFVKFPAYQNHE